MKCIVTCLVLIAAILGGQPAAAVTLDFEGLADLESVTTQFGGLTFSNTIALREGESLNEIDFPPASGLTIVSDDLGPITIVFDTPVASVSGLFTYGVPLTITAFDALLAPVDIENSLFSVNTAGGFGDPGSSPNEFIEVAFAGGIFSLRIEGGPDGSSFSLDDLTFVPAVVTTPESPTTALLTVLTAVFIAVAGRPRRRLEAVRFPIAR